MKRHSYRRNNRRSNLKFIVIAVVLAVLFTVFMFIYNSMPNRVRSLNYNLKPMTFNADLFTPYADGAVYSTEDGYLYHVNTDGDMTWGFNQMSSDMKLNAGPHFLSVYGGNKLQVVSSGGSVILEKLFDGEILSVKTSSRIICVSYQKEDGTVPIIVFNADGEQLVVIETLSAQKLMDFDLSEAGTEVWVMTLEESAHPIYHVDIHRFNPKHTLIGSLSIEDEAIYGVNISKAGTFLIGTKSINAYNSTNQLTASVPVFGNSSAFTFSSNKQVIHIISTVSKPYSSIKILQNSAVKSSFVLEPASEAVFL